MPRSDYVPIADNDLLPWLENLYNQALAHCAELGIAEATLATLKAGIDKLRANTLAHVQAQAAARHASEAKKASAHEVIDISRGVSRQAKASPGYTEALGGLLGIIGADKVIDPTALKPSLTGTDQTDGEVIIEFPKQHTDGVNIYEFDEATKKYVFLARRSHSPYIDKRPLKEPGKPELRRYTAIHVIGDDEVGQFSDELIVNCAP
ncbi:hypothetical protein [uncultured Thiodictyon sp.]|uniref:hypothetical protein n=1 Tax=uncultured Thiodictyon sp. TaxID=1846217 RepID=UPI0025E19060|nr:hypothetical protein [uncultured Thiodictyon sp.]